MYDAIVIGAGPAGLAAAAYTAQHDLKTVVISGMMDEGSFRKMPDQTDRFIAKPFKVSNLIQTLNDLGDVSN